MPSDTAVRLIQAGGVYTLAFAAFHLLFWRLFDWKTELRRLSFLNRAVMQVLNLSLTAAFVVFGTVSLAFPEALAAPGLGRTLLALMALFWLARAVEQVVFFKLRHWGSWAFLAVFLAGAGLYGAPAAMGG